MSDPERSKLDQFFDALRARTQESLFPRVVLILLVPLVAVNVIVADSWLARSYSLALTLIYAYVAWRVLRKES